MGFGLNKRQQLQLLSTEYPWLCLEIKKEGNPRSKKIVALCPLVGEIVEFAAIQTRQLSSLDTLGVFSGLISLILVYHLCHVHLLFFLGRLRITLPHNTDVTAAINKTTGLTTLVWYKNAGAYRAVAIELWDISTLSTHLRYKSN